LQEQTGSLVTKNEVFNEIANLRWGSSFLILDETHFESLLFLNALLKDAVPPKHVFVISFQNIDTPFEVRKLAIEEYTSLNDISIMINQLRDYIGSRGIIVHNYLPHILVREDEESTLRMLEFWGTKTVEKNLIEFYTLPQGTFPSLEKKLASLADGEINIKFLKKEERQFAFTVKKACKSEYHLREFPFIIDKERLLIKWGEEFTDKLPREIEETIRRKIVYLKSHMDSLKLSMGVIPAQGLAPQEYLLLTQLDGIRLDEAQEIFPDIFDYILEKIAKWNLQDILQVEEAERREPKPIKEHPSLRTRIALALPSRFAAHFLGGGMRKVPMDGYLQVKKTLEAICKLYMPTLKEPLEALPDMEEFSQELAARITALERIKNNREDPRMKFDESYLPKFILLTIEAGFGLKPKIRKVSAGIFEVAITDCLCSSIHSDKPACRFIGGAVVGTCSVMLKRKLVCNEVRCKAMGESQCVFLLKL